MSTADSEYESPSDVDSFGSVEAGIQSLNDRITELYDAAEALETHLTTLVKPLEGTQLAQLGQLPFCAASPFRHATFVVKPPGFPGVDLARRYPFHVICATLRAHLLQSGAVHSDGSIHLNAELQHLFGIQESNIGYITLLAHLRAVLV
jgi:hypothetical protein